jgi:hypothetical protein
MSSLEDALQRFNRKERNLLVRAVLGDEQKRLDLTGAFRGEITEKLKIQTIREEAWWATDYHINWLAGALAYYSEGDKCLRKARPNTLPGSKTRLVEGNQEDIDLVIASDRDLILVEVKAYGGWDVDQLQSKLDRFDLLRGWYEEQIVAELAVANPVQIHFLLMSPKEPSGIKVDWRTWKRPDSPIPWIPLCLPTGEPILEVNRCNEEGEKSAKGDWWRIVEH